MEYGEPLIVILYAYNYFVNQFCCSTFYIFCCVGVREFLKCECPRIKDKVPRSKGSEALD